MIGENSFWDCGLEELVLPASMRKISAKAFEYCGQLKNVQLNEGLEKLGEKEIIDGKEYEGNVFAFSTIESIRLPSTLKGIEANTFLHCENLKRVGIPNKVEYIGNECFKDSGIEKIVLPSAL